MDRDTGEEPDAALALDDGCWNALAVSHYWPGEPLREFRVRIGLRRDPPFPQCLLNGCEIIGLSRFRHQLGHLLGKQPSVALGEDGHPRQLASGAAVCVVKAAVNRGQALVAAHSDSIILS